MEKSNQKDRTWPSIGDFIENKIQPFFSVLVYLRVPLTISLISLFIFVGVDQTLDIYRLIIIEEDISEALLSTFSIVLLSISVWYSGRLLQKKKKDKEEEVEEGKESYTKKALRIIPRILGGIPLTGFSLGIFKACNGSIEFLFLLLFFSSIIAATSVGVRLIDKKQLTFNFIPNIYLYVLTPILWISLWCYVTRVNNEISNWFFHVWFIICCIVISLVLILFINRKNIFKEGNRLSSLRLGKIFSPQNDEKALFSNNFENFFVNVAYICFSALCLPIIAADSKISPGVIAIFALGLIFNLLLFWWRKDDSNQQEEIKKYAFASLIIAASFLLIPSPVALVNSIGAITVVAIALIIFSVVFSTIFHWGIENKIPSLTILIVLLVVFSWFNANDNHRIRQLGVTENRTLPPLETEFKNWLKSDNRKDLEEYEKSPVYLVATQGGGIFAAYHAATALSKLQDSIPNFSQHIFAISSVSGGSLGASAFSSLVKENVTATKKEKIEQKAKDLFSENLLSPLLSMGLFPDFVQRFLFWRIYEWDRAIGLEVAFERAWDDTQKTEPSQNYENPLKKSYYSHWDANGIAPALVINTTQVESGEPLRISPFEIPFPEGDENIFDPVDPKDKDKNIDFRLSTAASLSARFPFVTPVAWYEKTQKNIDNPPKDNNPPEDTKVESRLADGGYFDNSGVSTLLDIGRTLEKVKKETGRKFEVIYLSIVDSPDNSSNDETKNPGLNEVGSPIRTVINVRMARGKNVAKQAQYLLNDGIKDPFKDKFRSIYLNKKPDSGKLPLGWLLSQSSREAIDRQNVAPDKCNEDLFKEESNRNDIDVINHNSCVAKSIAKELKMAN